MLNSKANGGKQREQQQVTSETGSGDLSPSTFGIEDVDDAEDAAEADLDERVADLWGCSE